MNVGVLRRRAEITRLATVLRRLAIVAAEGEIPPPLPALGNNPRPEPRQQEVGMATRSTQHPQASGRGGSAERSHLGLNLGLGIDGTGRVHFVPPAGHTPQVVFCPQPGTAVRPSAPRVERHEAKPKAKSWWWRDREVPPPPQNYWQDQGWKQKGDRLVGFYHTPHGSFPGYVTEPQSPRPGFFLEHPPRRLWDHPHAICFHGVGRNVFRVHISPPPRHPDDGILAVERVLADAMTRRRR